MRPCAVDRVGGPRTALLSMLVAALVPAAVGLAALPDWTDVSATSLSGNPATLQDDTEEKDVIAGDLDKDGDTDVVVVRKLPWSVPGARPDLLLMNEGGVLTDRTTALANDMNFPTDARDVQIVDVDLDLWPDLVVVNTFDQNPVIHMNQGGAIDWQGLARDNSRLASLPIPPRFCAVGHGDVTGNGAPDLYWADYENTLEDRLWINDGAGFFTDETTARIAAGLVVNTFGTSAEILDLNMDGWADIITNHALEDVHILLNDTTGNFPGEQILATDQAYMLTCGDFNGDSRPDVYVVQDNQDRVLLNMSTNGNGTVNFQVFNLTAGRTGNFGGNVDLGDIDRDGDLDVYLSDIDIDVEGCDRVAAILENPGNGHMTDPHAATQPPHISTFDGRLADVDGDGWLDIYSAWCSGTRVFRNEAPTTAITLPATSPSTPVTALRQSTPNPFQASTTIEFLIGEDLLADGARARTALRIYDVQGRLVTQLLDSPLSAGVQQIAWDGRDAAGRRVTPGVYFYRLDTGGHVYTKKLSVLE